MFSFSSPFLFNKFIFNYKETSHISLIQDHVRQAYDKAISLDTEECVFYEKSFTDKQLREQELNNLFKSICLKVVVPIANKYIS